MKKTVFLFSMMAALALAPATKVTGADVVKVFNLKESGRLTALLAEAGGDADSVVVSGPMNGDDMKGLKSYCANGHVRGVDLGEVSFPGDSLPNIAFGYTGKDNPVENITLPKKLRTIGFYAFYNMGNLRHVEIPNTLRSIGYYAFASCTALRKVELNERLEELGNMAFYGTALEALTIPASVKSMGYSICGNSTNLKRLTILADIEKIRTDCALLCTQLETLELPSQVKEIEDEAFSSTNLETTVWPSALETIGVGAFSCCRFKDIVLPGHVSTIKREAFAYNEQLQAITLPACLQTIDQSALLGCPLLERVVCESTVPPATLSKERTPQAVLFVPEGTEDAYRAATWWKDFKEIRTYIPTAIGTIATDTSGNDSAYTLGGIVAPKHYRGVVIQRGKKTVIK